MNNLKVQASNSIIGLLQIEREVFSDTRGRFMTLHVVGELDPWTEVPLRFEEDDISISRKGVLRGLHGDDVTWKLVQCVEGSVFLAVADRRQKSPTYLKTFHLVLSSETHRQVLIPPGCVTGHQCLSDQCLFIYKQSSPYMGAGRQITVPWNDPELNIPWPLPRPILSDRDAAMPGQSLTENP